MRSFFRDWWQALRLPLDNHLRFEYSRRHRGWDPALNLFYILLILILQSVCSYLTFRYNLFESKISMLNLLAIFSTLGIIFTLVLVIIIYNYYDDYFQLIRKVARELKIPIRDLDYWPPDKLRQLVQTRLIFLARTLQAIETISPPYFKETVNAKNDFEWAYKTFLEAGLIEDTGYGPYFRA